MTGYFTTSALLGLAVGCSSVYAIYLMQKVKLTVCKLEYSKEKGTLKIFPNGNNNEKFIETEVTNIAFPDHIQGLKYLSNIRQHSAKFAKDTKKDMRMFVPEKSDSLQCIVDAIPHYPKDIEKFDKISQNTQPLPFYIKPNENQVYFLAVGFNNFCYIELDLLQKLFEGKIQEAEAIDNFARKGKPDRKILNE